MGRRGIVQTPVADVDLLFSHASLEWEASIDWKWRAGCWFVKPKKTVADLPTNWIHDVANRIQLNKTVRRVSLVESIYETLAEAIVSGHWPTAAS